MKEIQIFSSPQFGQVRIQVDASNEPLFCLVDIAKALGYSNPAKAVIDHCKGVTILETPTNGGIQKMKFGKEGELYRLILKSNVPMAEAFQSWVCDEVLPSIRKTGSYSMQSQAKQINLKDKLTWVKEVKKLLNLSENSTLSLLQKVGTPLGLPTPEYTTSKGILKSATELLRENNSTLSAREFNSLMIKHGYLADMTRKAAKGAVKHFKALTSKGKTYGENQVSPKAPNQKQPMYYADNFASLLVSMKGGAL